MRMMSLSDSGWRALLNTCLLMVLFYGVGVFYNRYYEKRLYFPFGCGLLISMIVISILRYLINREFQYIPGSTTYYKLGEVSFAVGAIVTNILVLLNSLLYHTVRSRMKLQQQRFELQTEQQAAQLQFLRAQMNPHFLFNTLNNIYSLAVVRSEKTAPLVLKLSELLRYVTYDTQDEKVLLSKEVKMLKEYIEMFQLQHEHPLDICFNCQLNNKDYRVEPLLLVPFVENCFKHCDFAENDQAFTHLQLELQAFFL